MRPLKNAFFQHGEEAPGSLEFEWHFGDQRKIGLLAGDGRAGGEEARFAAHQLHQGDAVLDAMALGVGTLQHLGCLFDGSQVAERTRHKRHIVVDGLGDAHDGERVAAPFGFLEEVVAAPLGAIPTDRKEHIDAMPDQVIHRDCGINGSAGGPEDGAALAVDVLDQFAGEGYWLEAHAPGPGPCNRRETRGLLSRRRSGAIPGRGSG